MTTIALGYLRVSSVQQRDRVTIASQRRDVPAYVAAQRWTLGGLYEDDGLSAWTGKLDARVGYVRLLAACRAARAPGVTVVVVVVAFDRLTRSEDPMERAAIVGQIHQAGAKIAIVGAGIQDAGTFAGDIYFSVMGAIAAEESRIKSARATAGHITSAMRGRNPRGVIPFGLTYDGEPAAGRWGIDYERAEVVREIVRRLADDESSGRIGADLERRGVKGPRNGHWTSDRIRAIVQSDTYLGRYCVDRRRSLVVPVPPIVDEDVLRVARAVLAGRYRRPSPRYEHRHLLAGLATCALCRASIGQAGRAPLYTYYRCLHRRSPPVGTPRCELPPLRTEPLDRAAWDAIADALGDPAVLDHVLAQSAAPRVSEDPEKHRAELARIDARQAALLDHAARGVISGDVADAQVRQLGAARLRAQDALRTAEAARVGIRGAVAPEAIEEALRLARIGVEHAPAEERPGLLRDLVSDAVLGPDHLSLSLRLPVATSLPGRVTGRPHAAPVTIPAGQLRIATPRRKAA